MLLICPPLLHLSTILSPQHQRFVTETRGAEPEILWLGDGLIQVLQPGRRLVRTFFCPQNLFNSRIWETSFCLMHCLNFGISVSDCLVARMTVIVWWQ